MPASKYARIRSQFKDLANKSSEQIEKLSNDYFGDSQVSNSRIQDFMVEASKNDQWLEEFNKALKLKGENKIKQYSKEDVQIQLEIMDPNFKKFSVEQKEQAIERVFATTGSDTSGTNVAIDPILPTNILDVDEYLFNNDSGVLSQVTIMKERGETQIPEFDVAPVPSRTTEAGVTTPVEIKRRDADDYKLNANIKVQTHTEINELALRKGSPTYFAKMRQALIREMQNELVKQVFNGTNGSQQFHGILQSIIPAITMNKRGSFDVTADTDLAAETNKFRKLVMMLGTLPSNTSEAKMKEYTWQMTRSTFYKKIVTSLDDNKRYYMDAIMNGTPILVGPGGLPIDFISKNAMADGTVGLNPMGDYFLNLPDGVELIDDGGLVNFIGGKTLVKAYCFADGGYARNFMRTTDWTTGADDNIDRNQWRFITGI